MTTTSSQYGPWNKQPADHAPHPDAREAVCRVPSLRPRACALFLHSAADARFGVGSRLYRGQTTFLDATVTVYRGLSPIALFLLPYCLDLLTWNSTHIANAEIRPKVERACRDNGYEPPVLCTPDELMGG
jgi:hypothetical protein